MKGVWFALSACLLGASLAVPSATASPATGRAMLTVTGTTTSYVDVRMPSRWTLDTDPSRSVRVTTNGTYALVYVAPLTQRRWPTFALAHLQKWPGGEWRSPIILNSTYPNVTSSYAPAGRYRIYLVTDGASTVQVPIWATSNVRANAVHRFRSTAAGYVSSTNLALGLGHFHETQKVAPNTFAFMAVRAEGAANQRAHLKTRLCYTRPGEDCDDTYSTNRGDPSGIYTSPQDPSKPWLERVWSAYVNSPVGQRVTSVDLRWDLEPVPDVAKAELFRVVADLP